MQRLNILILEKENSIQNLFSGYMHSVHTFDFTVTDNVKDALILYGQKFYHMVVIDREIEGGIEFSSTVRNGNDGIFHYILVMISDNTPERIEELLYAGCDDYILKTCSPLEFRLRIDVALFCSDHRMKRMQAESNLIMAKKHRETVLNSLNLGTALLDADKKLVYFNEPFQNMCDSMLILDEKLTDPLRADESNKNYFKNWLGKPEGKFILKTHSRWIEMECYPEKDKQSLLYAVDITELMQLRLKDRADLIGNSVAFRKVISQIDLLANGDWNVLIEGETGTGKELVAKQLHLQSPRAKEMFFSVNCAGLTDSLASSILFGHKKGSFTGAVNDHEGYFEAADGGTLFLDEIGDISPYIQAMLLRAIEHKEIIRIGENRARKVNVRIITATNKNLKFEAESGEFRDDLYYRLNESHILLPPLRDRTEDIPALIENFMFINSLQYPALFRKISNDTMKVLVNYDWPGNIRQLKSVIQFASIQAVSGIIEVDDLPEEIKSNNSVVKDIDEDKILKVLSSAKGNYSAAAAMLGISRATLYRKLKKYGIN